jgi:hypothetical protein
MVGVVTALLSRRLLATALLAAGLAGCTLPGLPVAKTSPSPQAAVSPSPVPSCTAAPDPTGRIVAGVNNPGGPRADEVFAVTLPEGWGYTSFSKLTKGFALRAFDDTNNTPTAQFVNITVSSTRVGSLSTKTSLADEVTATKKTNVNAGFKYEADEVSCQVGGTDAVALIRSRNDADKKATLYVYEVVLIGYTVDDIFGDPSATTFTVVGGGFDKDKDSLIAHIKSILGSWKWMNGYQGTPVPGASPAPSGSTSATPSS